MIFLATCRRDNSTKHPIQMSAVRRRGREGTPSGGLPSPNGVDDPQAKGGSHGLATTANSPPWRKKLDQGLLYYDKHREWLTPLLLTVVAFIIRFRNIGIWDKVWWECSAGDPGLESDASLTPELLWHTAGTRLISENSQRITLSGSTFSTCTRRWAK
jgi:hypothetical protein